MDSLKVKFYAFVCVVLCFSFVVSGAASVCFPYGGGITVSAEGAAGGNIADVDVSEEEQENPYKKDPVAMFLTIGFFLVCVFFVFEAIYSSIKKHRKNRANRFSRE